MIVKKLIKVSTQYQKMTIKNFGFLSSLNKFLNKTLMIESQDDIDLNIEKEKVKEKLTKKEKIKKKELQQELNIQENRVQIEPLNLNQLNLLNNINSRIIQNTGEEQFKPNSKIQILSIWEKLEYYETNNEGKLYNPHLIKALKNYEGETSKYISTLDKNKIPATFNTHSEYQKWIGNIKIELKHKIKEKLTPMEYNITQNIATERPFTGLYVNNEETGIYCCKVCTQRLFSNTQKYKSDAGWASFWNFLPFSVNLKKDHLNKFKQNNSGTGLFNLQYDNLPLPTDRLTCSNVNF